MNRPQIEEIVVVEGLHDKQAVDDAVDADVWVVGGDRIAHRMMQELCRASETRGVIILTDPDGPGERIRRRIDAAVPKCKHAFLPRALAVSSKGIGVEHAARESIRTAILAARGRVHPVQNRDRQDMFTLDDMRLHRLMGAPDSAQRRQDLGEQLRIGYGNAKAFLKKLNALAITREEFLRAVESLPEDGATSGG